MLAAVIPNLFVWVRRLHGSGKPGWFLLPFGARGVIPYIGFVSVLIQIIFFCFDSDPGTNKYGPNPEAVVSYRNAAEQEDAAAQCNLGILYDRGCWALRLSIRFFAGLRS